MLLIKHVYNNIKLLEGFNKTNNLNYTREFYI